ncbi:hypothetical protein FNF27_05229 [Cafeteria roenbergensis]|uniref:Abscisic acid G-protein coupled receptor-like domain-containing protein n=1 Tax=Cafeteria roenbergensis TaxID=33653 RepID=A0A5A8E818_CAFRO|nr:hypothetical protein FNF27_05229 [Cafeteria roenbergensis]
MLNANRSTWMALESMRSLSGTELASVAATYLAALSFGLIFYVTFLRRKQERMSFLAPLIFAMTFAMSFHMLVLAIIEVLGYLNVEARFALWRLNLSGLAVMQVGVVPWVLAQTLLTDHGMHWAAAACGTVPLYVGYLVLYHYLGALFPITASESFGGVLSLEGNVGRLGVLGVTTSALLAGYGGVMSPATWIPAFNRRVPRGAIAARAKAVRMLQAELVKEMLRHRAAQAEARSHGPAAEAAAARAALGGQSDFVLDLNAAVLDEGDAGTSGGSGSAAGGIVGGAAPRMGPSSAGIGGMEDRGAWGGEERDDGPAALSRRQGRAQRASVSAAPPREGGGYAMQLVGQLDGAASARAGRGRAGRRPVGAPGSQGWFALLCCCCISDGMSPAGRAAVARVHASGERVRTLHLLLQDETNVYKELHASQVAEAKSRTLQGRFFHVAGWLLLGYTVSKALMSVRNVLFSIDPQLDLITRVVDNALRLLHFPQWVQGLVQPASFVVVGAIVVTSTRGFLMSLAKVFRAVSSRTSGQSLALGLAFVMASYFISVVLLMRMAVPEQYREMLTRALGGVHFMFFHRWFDIVYIASITVVTATVVLERSSQLPMAIEVTALDEDPDFGRGGIEALKQA